MRYTHDKNKYIINDNTNVTIAAYTYTLQQDV